MSMQSITTWTSSEKELFQLASRFSDHEGTAFFYSGGEHGMARTSLLALFPEEKIEMQAQPHCWENLQSRLGLLHHPASQLPMWIGYLGYEMGCFADLTQRIPCYCAETPDCCFYRHEVLIEYDHAASRATLYARNGKNPDLNRRKPNFRREQVHVMGLSDSLKSYTKKIAQAKEWILDGEIYQVNLSQEIQFRGACDSFALFAEITRINPSPFSAFIQCGSFSVVSSSPERFLTKKRGHLESRPIKGTAPRSADPIEDKKHKEYLLNSPKEKAELLMITDLMRSDLGRISLPGSVQVKEFAKCEAYENVFHLLSIIEAKAEADLHPAEQVRRLFPGGSVTGCPKLRAMEAIYALEKRPRGIYTGSIGYFAANGDFDFNIAIRTLIVHADRLELQLGGGIVLDSDPVREFEETLHKGRSWFKILGVCLEHSLL